MPSQFCREILLRPEIEELIKQDVQRGPYQAVNEFVERAVSMLHEQEVWLAENGLEINAKIAAGYAAAGWGELTDADEVRSHMNERKRARLPESRQAYNVDLFARRTERSGVVLPGDENHRKGPGHPRRDSGVSRHARVFQELGRLSRRRPHSGRVSGGVSIGHT
jgi:hypothetical protein